jgi:hypothetical protein
LNSVTAPLLLNCTITRFVPTLPPDRLMFETSGGDPPAGYAVTYVGVALWSIAVMLITTA